MSRIGKLPIEIPEGVDIKVNNRTVVVRGTRGVLEKELPREIGVEINDGLINVVTKSKSKNARVLHGTYRVLIANMVVGVTKGWTKELQLVGTGYRAELSGDKLILTVGYSHPVEIVKPKEVDFKVEKTSITVEGIDKELVGQIAANIRDVRPPEPYKGKGIKYKDEFVRRKAGKAAKAQGDE